MYNKERTDSWKLGAAAFAVAPVLVVLVLMTNLIPYAAADHHGSAAGTIEEATGEPEALSVLQQTIEDFSSCVDRVAVSGGGSERVAADCQDSKATLTAMLPGLAEDIVHTRLQEDAGR